MTTDHFDDDENVKAMRETARTIGVTKLIVDAWRYSVGSRPISTTEEDAREFVATALDGALGLIGVPETERETP